MISQTPQTALDHQVYEANGELITAWDERQDVLETNVVAQMFEVYEKTLNMIAKNPDLLLQNINISLSSETIASREAINNTSWNIPTTLWNNGLIHERIFNNAKTNPSDTALIFEHQTISYGDLCNSALRVGGLLKANELQIGERVMLSVPRGPLEIVCALGILAAGGVYVPVSVTQPLERRLKIIARGNIHLVLATDAEILEDKAVDSNVLVLNPLATNNVTALTDIEILSAESSAYNIFTSGTTGEPKGVDISHKGALNTILDITERCHLDKNSRALMVSALDFDLSVFDIFGLLGVGGSLVLINSDDRRDAKVWLELVNEYQINTWNSVPVLLEMLLAVHADSDTLLPLQNVMLSGDWIPLELPQKLANAVGHLPKLLAMGGATEGSIWSNYFDVTLPLLADWKSIPYGYPLRNQKYRVVDANLLDCPDMVAGELLIGGVGVAKGYVNNEAITQKQFITIDNEIWYRTGDMGRYREGGILEFLGRIDHQVKVRGHRIELGEIENALLELPNVTRALAFTLDIAGRKHLGASLETTIKLEEQEVQAILRNKVPEYMVPEHISFYDKMPLNNNGKIDRKAVIADIQKQDMSNKEKPQEGLETNIAQIWQDILKVDDISRNDDFFMLGGDSLSATKFIQHLNSQGIVNEPLPLRVLFGCTTVKDLATYILNNNATLENDTEMMEEGTL